MKTDDAELFSEGGATARTPLEIEGEIRRRAFELHEQHGQHGHELEDWLQAEEEVRGGYKKAKAA